MISKELTSDVVKYWTQNFVPVLMERINYGFFSIKLISSQWMAVVILWLRNGLPDVQREGISILCRRTISIFLLKLINFIPNHYGRIRHSCCPWMVSERLKNYIHFLWWNNRGVTSLREAGDVRGSLLIVVMVLVRVRLKYATECTCVEYITPIPDNTSMPLLWSLAGFYGNLLSIWYRASLLADWLKVQLICIDLMIEQAWRVISHQGLKRCQLFHTTFTELR